MGADIHMYIQYREKKGVKENAKRGQNTDWWDNFGGTINPGRNYTMFSILAGVRGSTYKGFDPKGIPEFGLGWAARRDLFLYITEESNPHENCCTLEDAQRWGRPIIKDKDGKPWYTYHPDWHSHSWMTVKELKQAYSWYKKSEKYDVGLEYKVLLKTMKALENNGRNEVVVVFWFDN